MPCSNMKTIIQILNESPERGVYLRELKESCRLAAARAAYNNPNSISGKDDREDYKLLNLETYNDALSGSHGKS